MWAEGRLKLEPWLERAVARRAGVALAEDRGGRRSEIAADGDDRARPDVRRALRADHVILATGYKVDMARVPFLGDGPLAIAFGSQWLSRARRAPPDEHSRPVHHQHGGDPGLRSLLRLHGVGTRVGPDNRPLAPLGMRLVVGLGLAAGGMLSALSPRAGEPPAIGLSHVPVAITDLNRAASDFERLGFALKVGRIHDDGIVNRHAKFTDGTEVELINAPAATDALTGYYRRFLADGDGAAFLSLYPSPWTTRSSALLPRGCLFIAAEASWTFLTDMRWATCSSPD